MAKIAARGTLLKVTISAVLTTLIQLTTITIGETKSQCIDVESLDDAGVGIDKLNLGTASQADITFEGYYDPDAATHQFITDTIAAPSGFPVACSVVFTDSTPASATFNACGFGFSATAAVKDATKCSGSIEVDGVVSWPT